MRRVSPRERFENVALELLWLVVFLHNWGNLPNNSSLRARGRGGVQVGDHFGSIIRRASLFPSALVRALRFGWQLKLRRRPLRVFHRLMSDLIVIYVVDFVMRSVRFMEVSVGIFR